MRWGVLLFLLGLLTGLAVPKLANPRMGLSSHLEGVLNGMLLVVMGLIWSRLRLKVQTQTLAFRLLLFATFVNWGTTLLAAAWGAGAPMMPLAAGGHHGTPVEEAIVVVGLVTLTVALFVAVGIVWWGLRGPAPEVGEPAA